MRVRVLLQISDDDGIAGAAAEVAAFENVTERPEDLGLSIAEAKALLAAVQQRTVDAQVACWMERHRCCETCGQRRRSKGSHRVAFLTLYGDVVVTSPRLHRCQCQNTPGPARAKGKVERPFCTIKGAHETLYHFHQPETEAEAEANRWLARFIATYNQNDHRSEPHARIEDWLAHLPADG